jgi:hypothetical protein
MLGQIDKACNDAGVWPHVVLSAHAHNYQRFTRLHGKTSLYYLRQRRSRPGEAPPKGDKRAANTGAKTPDDFVTVDLAKRQLVHFTGE